MDSTWRLTKSFRFTGKVIRPNKLFIFVFYLVPELRLRSCSPRKEPANGMRSPTKMGDLTRSSPALLRSKTDMHHRVPNVNRSLTNLGGATSPEDLTLKEVRQLAFLATSC